MLRVVLGPTVSDELSNRVLTVCTRPRGGITEVALTREEAEMIVDAVRAAATAEPELGDIATPLADQSRAS